MCRRPRISRTIAVLATGLAGLVSAGPALAQYPERPIEMIVAFSAGGGTDIAARTLAPYIEKYLDGASIRVTNKPGAGGEIGFTEIARSAPDGYTIGFIPTAHMLAIPFERDVNYSIDSFLPVASVVNDPGGFTVRADSQFQALEDLVAYAKENPGTITYASSGIGSDDHIAALAFERAAGIEMTHVPFTGTAPGRAAVLGGHVDLLSANIGEMVPDIEEGNMRALGQMSEGRTDFLPDVPSFEEQGYDIFNSSRRVVVLPANAPEEVLQKLASAVEKAVQDPEFRKKAEDQGMPLDYMAPDKLARDMQRQSDEFRVLWEENPWVDG